jgi:PBSX family phage terminase large subunit
MIKLSELISPNFHDVYKKIKNKEYLHFLLSGGRGSTKSSVASLIIVLEIIKNAGDVIVLQRYQKYLRNASYSQILWAIDVLDVKNIFKTGLSPLKIICTKNGNEILFVGSDDPQRLKSIKPTNSFFQLCWFEELAVFNSLEDIRNILQSILRGKTSNALVLYSYNPPAYKHHFLNTFVLNLPDNYYLHKSNYLEVPEGWLGESFLTIAEQLKSSNLTAWEHEYLGKDVITDNQVFQKVSTYKELPDEKLEKYYGCDLGWVDPTVIVEVFFDKKNKNIYINREVYKSYLTNDNISDEIIKMNLGRVIIKTESAKWFGTQLI